jgi:hypothetical protein
MKVSDFIEMINWNDLKEQGIITVVEIDFKDKVDFTNNEIVGKVRQYCRENTCKGNFICFDCLNYQMGINVEYDEDEGVYTYFEEVGGTENHIVVKDFDGRFHIIIK